ncbi:hypothetical protein TNIN_253501 [Trichonephila inaurata madagascariensis]|uniref:Uncharacterized protein n=1 Tax=Trichonephila inaurata madagascariensis TaxID=2747483 RepID=A0A8X6X1T1_9ARAC|nr:hypothetical protein TNIN_253501 [Trichonephila inaurata madagascariensis]
MDIMKQTLLPAPWNEFPRQQGTLQQAVVFLISPPVPPQAASSYSQKIPHEYSPHLLPLGKPQQNKKDEDDFEFPPPRKTARKTVRAIQVSRKHTSPNVVNKKSLGPSLTCC